METAVTRTTSTHRFSSAQLLYGSQPRFVEEMEDFGNQLRYEAILPVVARWADDEDSFHDALDEEVYAARLAALDEMRNMSLEKRFRAQQLVASKFEDGLPPIEGDLVLVRRLAQIKHGQNPLGTKWEGPLRVAKVAKHGKSLWVIPLSAEEPKRKFHMNDVKIFIPRKECAEDEAEWRTIARNNDLQQKLVTDWMNQRRTKKKKGSMKPPVTSLPIQGPSLIDPEQPATEPIATADGDEEYWRCRAFNLLDS